MHKQAGFALLLTFAILAGCTRTVLVSVPPRVDLKTYGMIGVVDFASNAEPAVNTLATRQFQEQIHSSQPGTRFVELGNREALLTALGARQMDVATLKAIATRYAVDAVFLGDIAWSEPKTDINLTDLTRLEGGMRTEVRGDIASRLVETRTGASVWSSSAWAKRQVGRLDISADQGVSGRMSQSNPREEMLPAMIRHLTQDFRPTSVRQRVK